MNKLKKYIEKITSNKVGDYTLNFPHSDSETKMLWQLYERLDKKKHGEEYHLSFEDIHQIFRVGKLLKANKLVKISNYDKEESLRIANEPRFERKEKKVLLFIEWSTRIGLYKDEEEIQKAGSISNDILRNFYEEYEENLNIKAQSPINSLRNTLYNSLKMGRYK